MRACFTDCVSEATCPSSRRSHVTAGGFVRQGTLRCWAQLESEVHKALDQRPLYPESFTGSPHHPLLREDTSSCRILRSTLVHGRQLSSRSSQAALASTLTTFCRRHNPKVVGQPKMSLVLLKTLLVSPASSLLLFGNA